MLVKRIIPCLDIKGNRVVKGRRFINLRDAGDPVEAAKFYDKSLADELVFLDITASIEKRKTLIGLVERIAENIYIPFTVGGGIRTLKEIRDLLNAGADKVSLNTQAVKNPSLIKKAATRFGSQCIVVAIDAKKEGPCFWRVYINGGHTPTDREAVRWAQEAVKLGAGEILLTSIDYDGTKKGYDLELTRRISQAVSVPVIASGGAGSHKHFLEVFSKTSASAALAASVFHYRKIYIPNLKRYLRKNKVAVRI